MWFTWSNTMGRENKETKNRIDRYDPDYTKLCCNCGNTPVVTGVMKKANEYVTVYNSEMCGPCTFGSASCIDPEEWNKVHG